MTSVGPPFAFMEHHLALPGSFFCLEYAFPLFLGSPPHPSKCKVNLTRHSKWKKMTLNCRHLRVALGETWTMVRVEVFRWPAASSTPGSIKTEGFWLILFELLSEGDWVAGPLHGAGQWKPRGKSVGGRYVWCLLPCTWHSAQDLASKCLCNCLANKWNKGIKPVVKWESI